MEQVFQPCLGPFPSGLSNSIQGASAIVTVVNDKLVSNLQLEHAPDSTRAGQSLMEVIVCSVWA